MQTCDRDSSRFPNCTLKANKKNWKKKSIVFFHKKNPRRYPSGRSSWIFLNLVVNYTFEVGKLLNTGKHHPYSKSHFYFLYTFWQYISTFIYNSYHLFSRFSDNVSVSPFNHYSRCSVWLFYIHKSLTVIGLQGPTGES